MTHCSHPEPGTTSLHLGCSLSERISLVQEAEVEVRFDLSGLEDEAAQLQRREEQQQQAQQTRMAALSAQHRGEEDAAQRLLDELQTTKAQ